jgi:uncharacterized membrane protein YccC
VQLVIVLAIHWLAPVRFLAPAANASVTVGSILSQVRAMIEGRAPGLAHAFAMALAASAGEVLYRVLEMPNGYWVPMTVLLILRPAARETAARALARLLGTLCGVGLLTLLMALLRPSIPVLVGLIAATAWACYAFLRVNFAILSMAITMYVVLLFAIAGLPEPLVALHRAVATLLGGIIALSTHMLGCGVDSSTRFNGDANGASTECSTVVPLTCSASKMEMPTALPILRSRLISAVPS